MKTLRWRRVRTSKFDRLRSYIHARSHEFHVTHRLIHGSLMVERRWVVASASSYHDAIVLTQSDERDRVHESVTVRVKQSSSKPRWDPSTPGEEQPHDPAGGLGTRLRGIPTGSSSAGTPFLYPEPHLPTTPGHATPPAQRTQTRTLYGVLRIRLSFLPKVKISEGQKTQIRTHLP